ncbi:MAG: zinc ribbon domain-containing protein [Lachnospiraceae bacterium]|nr:zinc ribbon domain-containing protein [Lachnospiraceae bacterium]MDD3659924.1 zinc ribbon domain-containing protein [Lachnospiraceae bacterium]
MYCKKCGTLNNDDANYCELCGNRLEKNMRAEKELTTELNSDNLLKGSKSSDGVIKYLMAGISITIAIIFCIGMIFSKGSLLTDTKNSISNRNQSQKSEQGLNESSREYQLIEDNIVDEKQESENMK